MEYFMHVNTNTVTIYIYIYIYILVRKVGPKRIQKKISLEYACIEGTRAELNHNRIGCLKGRRRVKLEGAFN
jgi:hypothetical protein